MESHTQKEQPQKRQPETIEDDRKKDLEDRETKGEAEECKNHQIQELACCLRNNLDQCQNYQAQQAATFLRIQEGPG